MKDAPLLPDELRPLLRDFLAQQSTLVLATAGIEDGRSQVAPLFFVSDEAFNLYWVSDPDSRHSRNLEDWNDVAVTVYAHTWEWQAIQGLQIEGDAVAVIDDEERQQALALYKKKFDFVNERFEDLLEKSVVYVLRPRWLRWIDNRQRFGYKQEFSLGTSESAG